MVSLPPLTSPGGVILLWACVFILACGVIYMWVTSEDVGVRTFDARKLTGRRQYLTAGIDELLITHLIKPQKELIVEQSADAANSWTIKVRMQSGDQKLVFHAASRPYPRWEYSLLLRPVLSIRLLHDIEQGSYVQIVPYK